MSCPPDLPIFELSLWYLKQMVASLVGVLPIGVGILIAVWAKKRGKRG